MIAFPLRRAANIHREDFLVEQAGARRAERTRSRSVLWFTGLSGSGKSTIANLVERELHAARPAHLHASTATTCATGLNRDLGFTDGGPGREHPPRRRGGQAVRWMPG